jgi:hypothetical protein
MGTHIEGLQEELNPNEEGLDEVESCNVEPVNNFKFICFFWGLEPKDDWPDNTIR